MKHDSRDLELIRHTLYFRCIYREINIYVHIYTYIYMDKVGGSATH